MKSEHKNLKDPIKYMEYAYYYMRFYLMVQTKRKNETDQNPLSSISVKSLLKLWLNSKG